MQTRIFNFIKKESVLTAAVILALISMFIIPPSAEYLSYIDWRTLGILLSLMTITSGFKKNGFFKILGEKLLSFTKTSFQLFLMLVFLCFISSMLITNDVALITFVPFAILTLKKAGRSDLILPVIVMQTIAANLGSMFTPIGNPQNLYLYQLSGMDIFSFLKLMFPYTAVSGLIILIFILLIIKVKSRKDTKTEENFLKASDEICIESEERRENINKNSNKLNLIYGILFILCLFSVMHIIPFYIALLAVLLTVIITDREVLKNVDYSLLFTFIALFIFTGNIGKITAFTDFLKAKVQNNELLVGITASQFISNVPAALLLSGFTSNLKALILGVNIGGLGTLIASMASLISYKFYAEIPQSSKKNYMLVFTVFNLLFLIILCGFSYIFN